MSSQENGIPFNIATNMPPAINIVSSTNATPIKVTATAHGMTSGDLADVRNHQTNTAANGTWVVTVVDANNVLLVGSAGNGVGGATGTIQSLALGPTFAVPSDGDPRNAASVDVALESLADRTAWLGAYTGAWTLIDDVKIVHDDNGAGNVWGTCSIGATNTWTAFTGLPALAPIFTNVTGFDLLEFQLDTSINFDSAMKNFWIALYVGQAVPAGSPSYSYTRIPGASKVSQSSGALPIGPLTLRGVMTGASKSIVGISLYGLSQFYTGSDAYVLGDYTLSCKHWRATGKPQ